MILGKFAVTASLRILLAEEAARAQAISGWQASQSGDYGGDGTTEIAIYRPATGLWENARRIGVE